MKPNGIYFTNKYATGSILSRHKKMTEIRKQIYSAIIDEYNIALTKNNSILGPETDEFVPLRTLEKNIKKILPEKLYFDVRKKKGKEIGDYIAALVSNFDNDVCKSRHIVIPAEKNQLNINDLPTFMHEITHLLDFALNPKYTKIFGKLNAKKFSNTVDKIFIDLYYTEKKIPLFLIKFKTKYFLKGLPANDKLLILKYFKCNILTEINAYNTEKICCDELNKFRVRNLYFNKRLIKIYRFQDKIKLIDKMRLEILSQEHKKQNFAACSPRSREAGVTLQLISHSEAGVALQLISHAGRHRGSLSNRPLKIFAHVPYRENLSDIKN